MKSVLVNNKTYVFKKATLSDIQRITDLYNQGNKTANADIVPVSVDNRTAWFVAHGYDRPIMGLYDANQLIAWVSLSNLYDRPAYHISTEISIYIDLPHQGLGIGKVLLNEIMVIAKNLNIINIVALIYNDNKASVALFTKAGFQKWGILPKICQIDNQYKDVVMMGKNLQY